MGCAEVKNNWIGVIGATNDEGLERERVRSTTLGMYAGINYSS